MQWVATRTNTSAVYVCTERLDADLDPTSALSEAEKRRHYALHFNSYTHFTSPIRRYADLLVHRLLRAVLDAEDAGKSDRGGLDVRALEAALTEHGVSREQMVGLVDRTNHQAKGAKYTQQDCERLLAMRYILDTGGTDGLTETAVVVSVDENGAKLLIQRLDLEHMVRARDLTCKAVWDGESKRLRVFPKMKPEPRDGGGGRGKPKKKKKKSTPRAQEEVDEGEPIVIDVEQMAVLKVRMRATFGSRTPSLAVEFV